MTRKVKLAYPYGDHEIGEVVDLPVEEAAQLVFEGRAIAAPRRRRLARPASRKPRPPGPVPAKSKEK